MKPTSSGQQSTGGSVKSAAAASSQLALSADNVVMRRTHHHPSSSSSSSVRFADATTVADGTGVLSEDKMRAISHRLLELAKSKAFRLNSVYDNAYDDEDDEDEDVADDVTSVASSNAATKLMATTTTANHKSRNVFSQQARFQVDRQLVDKLNEIGNYFDLSKKHQQLLQKQIATIDSSEAGNLRDLAKALDERATIFRVTITSLMNSCKSFVSIARKQTNGWQRAYNNEHELRVHLEQMVEQMAKQMKHFEKLVMKADKEGGKPVLRHMAPDSSTVVSDDTQDDDFHDALDQSPVSQEEIVSMPLPALAVSRDPHDPIGEEDESDEDEDDASRSGKPSVLIKISHQPVVSSLSSKEPIPASVPGTKRVVRRTRIPPKPDYSLNLWGIIKNCVGKDLSRIPVPVNFSEPISMLQRLTEELEYTDILDQASLFDADPCRQMAYVAAFTISAYSTTAERAAKPFNPLLGETYECDRRDDLGWRSIAEQVSHHPPSLSNHAEGKTWTLWQQFTMTSKFRGQYLSIVPLGHSHLLFPASGNHYTWRKVTTCVQNIIVGKLWIDNVGEMDIVNQKTKDKCHLKYYEYSYFSKEPPRKVMGIVTDHKHVARFVINGKWNEMIECAEVVNPQIVSSHSRLDTSNPKVIWKRRYAPSYMASMYNFTELAVQLNEMEEGVAPTDSRMRPDQRLMEQGQWDEANREKLRLEQKQRDARRRTEERPEISNEDSTNDTTNVTTMVEHIPCWFKKKHDPYTDTDMYVYTDEYWKCKEQQNWSRCPDIF